MSTERGVIVICYQKPDQEFLSVKADVDLTVTIQELTEACRQKLKLSNQNTYDLMIDEKPQDLKHTLKGIGFTGARGVEFVLQSRTSQGIDDRLAWYSKRLIRETIPSGVLTPIAFKDIQGRIWPVNFFPFIIGRRNEDLPQDDFLLGIDLHEVAQTKKISRWHACVDIIETVSSSL